MSSFDCLNPIEFSFIAFLIGTAIAENLNSNQQNSIGNFLLALGQQIIVINAQETLIEAECEEESICEEVKLLKKQIELLEEKISKKK